MELAIVLEISFMNLSLRGGMESGPLTKPSGSLCSDEQLLWMSLKILEQGERRFLLESNTEAQRKPGHHEAGSCFPLSPLSYGFWSNLVPMESSFLGASNA